MATRACVKPPPGRSATSSKNCALGSSQAVSAPADATGSCLRTRSPFGRFRMASLICSVLAMLVLAKTDPNIGNSADLTTRIATAVEIALNHRREHITRVEVHVTDETADPMDGVNQLRCAIEARLEHRQPIAVVHRAAS